MTEAQGEDVIITIRDCNSITRAEISLRTSALNVKYGANGVGKSTIARALSLQAQGQEALDQLLPFKHRGAKSEVRPQVTGAGHIKKVLLFDDSYVSQFTFQRDEVLKDSFEIFINTDEYREGIAAIEALFERIKSSLSAQKELEDIQSAFVELRDAFGLTKSGQLAKTSRGFKAIGMGGKLTNIPRELSGYRDFLQSENPAGWITWQAKGKPFLTLSEHCPFCSNPDIDKTTAETVSQEYESAAVKNLSALRGIIDRLGGYFEESHRKRLRDLVTSIEDLSPEQAHFLANLRGQVDTFLLKLTSLRELSFQTLRDVDNVGQALLDSKIDLSMLDALRSEDTTSVVDPINDRLDEVAQQIDEVRAEIGKQKSRVARLVKDNQADVNQFLQSAGYRYRVRIEPTVDSYRMILEHEDAVGHLESAALHLSYGERNAFALVLFMHHVRRESPDLVVLDDPVSSFDKTKKFAILYQLFHGKHGIRDFTTLFLTHDIEPAIDIVLNPTANKFEGARPLVNFLRGHSGSITEKRIERGHFSTFSQVCDQNIAKSSDDAIKCIYLRRRYDVHGNLGVEYDVLSSLLHLRKMPDHKAPDGTRTPLSASQFSAAMQQIRVDIPGLDYDAVVQELSDPVKLKKKFDSTNVGYEKVQIFRMMLAGNPDKLKGDDTFKKFVNETYHIENEYVMQLNPREFDTVPEYVVSECEKLISQAAR